MDIELHQGCWAGCRLASSCSGNCRPTSAMLAVRVTGEDIAGIGKLALEQAVHAAGLARAAHIPGRG